MGNEAPRGKPRGISTKDAGNTNAASSGVFTLRENKTHPTGDATGEEPDVPEAHMQCLRDKYGRRIDSIRLWP